MSFDTVFIYRRDITNPDGFTASDWRLFADMPDADRAAVELTDAVFKALHAPTRALAEEIARAALDAWCHVGAYDTEPRNLMMSYLDAAFGVDPHDALIRDKQAQVDAAVDSIFAQLEASIGCLH